MPVYSTAPLGASPLHVMNPANATSSRDDSHLTDEKIQQLFEKFQIDFDKTYADAAEKQSRFQIFRENVIYIHRHNQQPHQSYRLGINEFADQKPAEIQQNRYGYAEATKNSSVKKRGVHKASGETPPESIDWSHLGAVTKVKNQAQCGSCYSFSATGAMEGAYEIATGRLLSFSEQQIVDCSQKEGNNGCKGGLMDNVFEYVETHGLCTEEDYPYNGKDGVCESYECTPAIQPHEIVGIKDVEVGDTQAMMEAVSKGPVSVAIEADKMAFQFYEDGVLSAECGDKLDHGVLLVGYGNLDGKDYWKVKNSWGPNWGQSGYVLLERGVTAGPEGECGILLQGSYPVFDLDPSHFQAKNPALLNQRSLRAIGDEEVVAASTTGSSTSVFPVIVGVLAVGFVAKKAFQWMKAPFNGKSPKMQPAQNLMS